jgi:arylsulfatase A-like enzyme
MAGKAKQTSNKQPNILVIWGDDIGTANLSCYAHGVMGYKTPNIDRLAKEAMANKAAPLGARRSSQARASIAPG